MDSVLVTEEIADAGVHLLRDRFTVAAEHAIGLLLALARNIPQAHAALVQGRWERRRYAGVELADKTLAIVGFGRIGQLVAARARALGMRVVVHDPFVSAERCRELQVTPGSLENDNVVLTPHLGASTQEAQDRAGVIVAEQVAAALAGGFVANAVNVPQVGAEDMEVLGPYLPLATKLGRLAVGLRAGGLERIDVTCAGALAEHDTRLITQAVLMGAFASRSDEPVNLVNARAVAESRGIKVGEERTRT